MERKFRTKAGFLSHCNASVVEEIDPFLPCWSRKSVHVATASSFPFRIYRRYKTKRTKDWLFHTTENLSVWNRQYQQRDHSIPTSDKRSTLFEFISHNIISHHITISHPIEDNITKWNQPFRTFRVSSKLLKTSARKPKIRNKKPNHLPGIQPEYHRATSMLQTAPTIIIVVPATIMDTMSRDKMATMESSNSRQAMSAAANGR